jgi:hypothetical protein
MNRGGGLATLTVCPCDGAAMAWAAAPRGSAQRPVLSPDVLPRGHMQLSDKDTKCVFDTWNRAGQGGRRPCPCSSGRYGGRQGGIGITMLRGALPRPACVGMPHGLLPATLPHCA